VSLILFSPWKQSLSVSNPKPMEFTAAEGKFHYTWNPNDHPPELKLVHSGEISNITDL